MYRNIYSYVDTDDGWKTKVKLFTWDDDGTRIIHNFDHECHLMFEDVNGKYESIYGSKLAKKTFTNTGNRKKFIQKNTELKYYEIENPEREFLQKLF